MLEMAPNRSGGPSTIGPGTPRTLTIVNNSRSHSTPALRACAETAPRGLPNPAHPQWFLEGSGLDSRFHSPVSQPYCSSAPSLWPWSSCRHPQNPEARRLNSPSPAPRGLRHFPAFNSKAESSSSGPRPLAPGRTTLRLRRRGGRRPQGSVATGEAGDPCARASRTSPHTWFRPPEQWAVAQALWEGEEGLI